MVLLRIKLVENNEEQLERKMKKRPIWLLDMAHLLPTRRNMVKVWRSSWHMAKRTTKHGCTSDFGELERARMRELKRQDGLLCHIEFSFGFFSNYCHIEMCWRPRGLGAPTRVSWHLRRSDRSDAKREKRRKERQNDLCSSLLSHYYGPTSINMVFSDGSSKTVAALSKVGRHYRVAHYPEASHCYRDLSSGG